MEIIFLGVNDVGMRLYEWLCDRDSTNVLSLITTTDQLELVKREQPEMLVSVGFDHLVPPTVLEIPSRGAINLHPSLLPHNRGKSPNVWPLIEDTPAGVTLHYMDSEFDTGEIIAQCEVETDFSDIGKDIHERLEAVQYNLFTDVWPDIENNTISATPQEDDIGTYHSTEDFQNLCELDPDENVQIKKFLDRLRALTFPPFNNAYLEVDGTRYYIDVNIREATDDSDEQREGLLSSY